MGICGDLICDLCQNRHVGGRVCFGCIDYDSFAFNVDSLEDALESAQILEADINEKLQGYMQENTHLRVKLEAAEKRAESYRLTLLVAQEALPFGSEARKAVSNMLKAAGES